MTPMIPHKTKGGRPSDPLVNELIVPYPDPMKAQSTRHKCKWCTETFAARNTVRARKHAAFDCLSIPEAHKNEVMAVLEKRDIDGRAAVEARGGPPHCATCTCVLHECYDAGGVRVAF